MPYQLPPDFATRANRICTFMHAIETTGDPGDQDLRQALITACDLLRSIDLDGLHVQMTALRGEVPPTATPSPGSPTWDQVTLGRERSLAMFLSNLGAIILREAGLCDTCRRQISRNLIALREHAFRQARTITADITTGRIQQLRDDICLAKEQASITENRQQAIDLIARTIYVVVIAANAVGDRFVPIVSPAALHSTIIVGTVGLGEATMRR